MTLARITSPPAAASARLAHSQSPEHVRTSRRRSSPGNEQGRVASSGQARSHVRQIDRSPPQEGQVRRRRRRHTRPQSMQARRCFVAPVLAPTVEGARASLPPHPHPGLRLASRGLCGVRASPIIRRRARITVAWSRPSAAAAAAVPPLERWIEWWKHSQLRTTSPGITGDVSAVMAAWANAQLLEPRPLAVTRAPAGGDQLRFLLRALRRRHRRGFRPRAPWRFFVAWHPAPVGPEVGVPFLSA